GALSLTAAGEIRPGGGAVDLALDGPMKEFRERLPLALGRFIVDGDARVQGHATVAPATPAATPDAAPAVITNWTDWALAARDRKSPDETWTQWLAKQWTADSAGT